MKKVNEPEMRPEYDFRGGVRGKHAAAYRQGHTVMVHNSDGTEKIQYFTLQDGAVMLEPDVKKYFPDSESVNHALRTLIELIPVKTRSRVRKHGG
ncbi:MAG TPA: hypothetical protein VF173_01140 [Thermoanaerobaculia bacterium]|nr:hypothetical protein [Thermoanaerobaculia bacterium]